ncbi:MAG TPA: 2-phospho-L-lactate guanylyltransferase [Rhizomicrobium sp.]|jgi:2-phospho-L-lactate guanylyltransferase|nr:2-phospho-L-lactate guanylyltransferase [Rhizomicrobium sp.]
MSLRIIIPAKPFAEAKQRLSPTLNQAARARVAEEFFRHVLATALVMAPARAVIVVSRGHEVLALAEELGATGVAEASHADLNAALWQAAEFAHAHGASKVLVLASDLPLLCDSDLAALIAETCAVAPDRHGRGTNALLWPAIPTLGFHFGDNSFAHHCAAARAAGVDPKIISRPGLAHDVDFPSDLFDLPSTAKAPMRR